MDLLSPLNCVRKHISQRKYYEISWQKIKKKNYIIFYIEKKYKIKPQQLNRHHFTIRLQLLYTKCESFSRTIDRKLSTK